MLCHATYLPMCISEITDSAHEMRTTEQCRNTCRLIKIETFNLKAWIQVNPAVWNP